MILLTRRLSRLSQIFVLFFVIQFSFPSIAQESPGGVNGYSIWYMESDLSRTLGNYHTFDLLNFKSEVSQLNLDLQKSSTFFFVLKPNEENASGQFFMSIGEVQIFDDHIEYGRVSSAVSFRKDVPAIVSIQNVTSSRYARSCAIPLVIGDTSLYSIAELVVYPKVLNREEERKVTSFLALKYSITITENEDDQWRDYWRSDNYTYWNRRIDGSHQNRVVALGRLDNQSIYQTQTVTTSGVSISIALDHFEPIGEMPEIDLDDDCFIIFSESTLERSTSFECAEQGSHPLAKWKLQLQGWNSEAEYILIKYPLEDINTKDTLFLTDGRNHMALNKIISASDEIYQIPLSALSDFRHYFFTTSTLLECESKYVEVENGILAVSDLPREENIQFVDIQNLNDGSSIRMRYNSSGVTENLQPGQYLVSFISEEGEVLSTQVVSNDLNADPEDQGNNYSLVLYPDPIKSGQNTTLSAHHLPGEGPVHFTLSDMGGRILLNEDLDDNSSFDWEFNAPMNPGTYTVTVFRGDLSYSLKLIVAQ